LVRKPCSREAWVQKEIVLVSDNGFSSFRRKKKAKPGSHPKRGGKDFNKKRELVQ